MIDLLFKHSKKLLAILFIAFIFLLTGLNNFQLDASSDSLVLEGDEDLAYYNNLRKNYTSDDSLIISYQANGNLLDTNNLEFLKSFVNDLKSLQNIKNITSILTVPLFSSPPLSIMDLAGDGVSISKGNANLNLAKLEFKTSPIYANNLVSADGKTTAILISFDKKHTKQIIKNIRSIVLKHKNNTIIFLGGLPLLTNDIIEYIGSDLVIFSIMVILVMAIILLIIFKNMRFMLLPIGVAIVSAISMSAVLGLMDWKVTVISSNFFSLLLVMTLSVMIHLVVRYRELSLNPDLDSLELIKTTLKQMFKPCFYTTITTLIAFVSLLISGIRPVIDFGYMMAIGVILSFVLSFLIFPLVMSILPKITTKKVKLEAKSTMFFAKIVDKSPKIVIIATLSLVLFSIIGINKITVENRFIDYFKSDTEIHQGLLHIDKNLGGTIPLEIIFDDLGEDYFYDSNIRDDIEKVHKYLDSRDELGKVLSIDIMMQVLEIANGSRPSGFFLNIIKGQIPESAKEYIYTPFINEDSGEIRMVVRVLESYPGLNRNELIKSIQADIENMGFSKENFHINGLMVLYNNMLQSLFDSQIKTIIAVFLMIWLMFAILFKSIKVATIAIVPNMIPATVILGVMGNFGIPLDLMTITIAAIAIGIGVDNAIHYITRFKIEFAKTKDYKNSMFGAHSSIGLAMFYTSIAIIIGFMVLTFSNFVPSIYFGIFTALAMFSAVVINLTLLPYLLVTLKPRV